MNKTELYGRDLLTGDDWSFSEIERTLRLALLMKKNRHHESWQNLMKNKSFAMLFYNSSLRTRMSFEAAVTELGGRAQYLTPESTWVQTNNNPIGESIVDAVHVMSRYVAAIGIRILLNQVKKNGEGHKFLKEIADLSDLPIINMADDLYHPCQAFADLMGWSEYLVKRDNSFYFSNLKGKTLLVTWGHSPLIRPWSSIQSHLLVAAKLGMNIRLARPEGYDLLPEVYRGVQNYCFEQQTRFDLINSPDEGYSDADVVYVRHWISNAAYPNGNLESEQEKEKSLAQSSWIVTSEKMAQTNNAAFANPMPIMRDYEAENAVVDSKNSIIYNVAENRLHVQKAILALVLGERYV